MKNITLNLQGSRYLSEVLTDFPFAERGQFRFFHKGETGCGGTTFVKETTDKIGGITICLMPSVASVISKENQFKGDDRVVCLYGSSSPNFHKYGLQPLTVFATYDKYGKLKDYLKDTLYNCRLVVDEYHVITRDSYREVMIGVLSGLNKYHSVTFLTATPDEILIKAVKSIFPLREIDILTCDWGKKKQVHFIEIKNDFQNKIADLINNWEKNHTTNLYLMLNNLEYIDRIVQKCGLSDYNILCSNYNSHRNDGIDGINNNQKRINFLTAAGYEGCDILDSNGEIVCAVDLVSNSTIFDVQTIVQMIGRCRGSQVMPTILYHYSNYRTDQTFDVNFKYQRLEVKRNNIEEYAKNYDSDIITVDGKHIINPIVEAQIERETTKFEKLHSADSFRKYLKDNGIEVIDNKWDVSETKKQRVRSFREACKLYEDGKYAFYDLDSFVKEAYSVLGKEMIEKLDYNKNAVKRAMEYATSQTPNATETLHLIKGNRYTAEQLKKRIEQVNIICGTSYSTATSNINRTIEELGFTTKITTERSKFIGDKEYELEDLYKLADENGITYTKGKKQQLYDDLKSKGFEVVEKVTKFYYIIDGGVLLPKVRVKPYKRFTPYFSNNCPSPINDVTDTTTSIDPTAYRVSYATKAGVVVKNPKFTVTDLNSTIGVRPKEKKNQYLISDGYNTTEITYSRNETSFNATDTLILDVDNGVTIDEFNKYVDEHYGNAFRWITKTYSHKEEHHKYRVIFPLSETLHFDNTEDVKAYKKTKFNMFDIVQDPQCQMWVYAPIDEIVAYGDESVMLDTDYVKGYMDWYKAMDNATSTNIINVQDEAVKIQNYTLTSTSNLDKEIERIEYAVVGERDTIIFQVVSRLKDRSIDDIYKVYNGITDSEKRVMFRDKVKAKLGISI